MGEEVQRDLTLEDGGDSAGLNKHTVVENKEAAAAAAAAAEAFVLAEEVKAHCCTLFPRVFSTGKALGGHVSSVHGPLKKFGSPSKKLKSMKETPNERNSMEFQIGKFTCKFCGKNFPSEKGVHGHMRLHPERKRRGTKLPTELEIENPRKHPLEPEILADGSDSELLPIAPVEDFIKNLREKTVTGRRGRPGTKPHEVNSPETCLKKNKALLSGDPQELRKIVDRHDDSGYFSRTFGSFLDFPWPEIEGKKRDIQGDFEMGNYRRSEDLETTSSYYCSNCPLVCSEKLIADSISKDI